MNLINGEADLSSLDWSIGLSWSNGPIWGAEKQKHGRKLAARIRWRGAI